jgi:MFS transporter, Spinster family, sphingosine-1-phosphate transporter
MNGLSKISTACPPICVKFQVDTPASPRERFNMKSRTILWLLVGLNLLNYIDRWIIAAIVPPMQAELGMSNTQAGFVMSAFMLGYFVTSPLFGYLTDRMNRIKLVAVGTTLWSLATGASGLGRSALQVFFSRTAVGVGEATLISASPSLVADLFSGKKLVMAMALLSATIPVGSAMGFILGGQIWHHWGWRMAFFVAGAPGLIFALIFFLFIKEPPRGTLEVPASLFVSSASTGLKTTMFPEREAGTFWKDIKSLLKNKPYVNLVIGYAAWTFTVGGFASWAPKYLVAVRGVELQTADNWFGALTVITGFAGSLFGGVFGGNMRFAMIVTVISIPLTFAAFLIPNPTAFYIFIGLAEFFLFAGLPAINVATVESVGPFLRGMASALSIFAIHLFGDFISPPLVGFFADKINLQIGVLILPVVLILSPIFFWRYYLGHSPFAKPVGETLS